MSDVVRGLRHALAMLVLAVLVALAVAALWFAIQGGGFRVTLAITLMAIATVVGLTGGAEQCRPEA